MGSGVVFLGGIIAFLVVIIGIVAAVTSANRRKRLKITQFAQNGAVIGEWIATGNYTVATNGQLTFEMPAGNSVIIKGEYRIEELPKGQVA